MKRLGPILMIAFGSVLTFGALTSGGAIAGAIILPCDTVPTTAFAVIPNAASVAVTFPPTCDTVPTTTQPTPTTTQPTPTTTQPTPTTLGVPTTLNGSGAQLPGTGSSPYAGVKLVIGLSLITLGAVLLLVRRRSRTLPIV